MMEKKGNKKYAISDSMFLRYRLMSLLYLLFLVLAITQVSNAWMPLTGWIGTELRNEQQSISLNSEEVYEVITSDSFLGVRNRLIELRETDERSEGLVQRYIVEGELGVDFQKEILRLFGQLPEEVRNNLEKGVMSDDFENGIAQVDDKSWLKWKFKNLTPSLAEIVFEQMTLAVLNVAEASETDSKISPTRRWDVNDLKGYRYIGDSIALSFPGGIVEWSRNGSVKDLGTGKYHVINESDLGKWTYRVLSEDGKPQAIGKVDIRTKPKKLAQKSIETTAFWLPGDTIKIFNSLWKKVSIPSNVGKVSSTGDGLFYLQFNAPGTHKYDVTLTTGVIIQKEAVVNEFPVPELRRSIRVADLSIADDSCVELIPDDEESNYSIVSIEGVIVFKDAHEEFALETSCLNLKDLKEMPVAIHYNKIILEFRGNKIEMNHHTMKVL